MHPFLGNWVRQSSVRSCIMPGIPHLVQDLSVGSVNADFQALSPIQRTDGMLLDLEGLHICHIPKHWLQGSHRYSLSAKKIYIMKIIVKMF